MVSAKMCNAKVHRTLLMDSKRRCALRVAAAFAVGYAAPARSQAYPTRPITVVAPVLPGATHDAFIRLLAPRLAAALGQPLVVENRNGGGQSIGTLAVSRARPDGHTLLLASNAPFTINPVVSKVGYDPLTSFEPVINVESNSMVLVVRPDLPVKTVQELLALARSSKGRLLAASSGNGSTGHLSLSQMNALAGVGIMHVPYRGDAAAVNDLVSGQVHMAFASPTSVVTLARQGRLRMLATTGTRRSVLLPELPTVAEQGLAGFQVEVWFGLFAPKGTSKDIVRRLNTEVARLVADPEIARQMLTIGLEPDTSTPEELAEQVKREIPVWRQIVMKAGVTVE